MTSESNLNGEIFTIRVRKCKRCGGILTSSQAIADGYGHTCKIKIIEKKNAQNPIDGQINFFEAEEAENISS